MVLQELIKLKLKKFLMILYYLNTPIIQLLIGEQVQILLGQNGVFIEV